MRCQICNRETNNWKKNKQTGKYESICNRCQNVITDTNNMYQDMDEDIIDARMTNEEFIEALKEADNDSRRANKKA